MGPLRQPRRYGSQHDVPPNSEMFPDRSLSRPRAIQCTRPKIWHPLSSSRKATDTQLLVDNLNAKFKETHTKVI